MKNANNGGIIEENKNDSSNSNENSNRNAQAIMIEKMKKMRFLKTMEINHVIVNIIMKFVTNFQMSTKYYPKRVIATVRFLSNIILYSL